MPRGDLAHRAVNGRRAASNGNASEATGAHGPRHEVCLMPGMTLPYPREVETGQLKPRRPAPRVTFDVEASVAEAIRFSGSNVEIFGVRFAVDEARTAEAVVERYRADVATHFNERVATPDAQLWQEFADIASAQVEQHTRLDDDILGVLRSSIDNL
jgi:hypothetical protein